MKAICHDTNAFDSPTRKLDGKEAAEYFDELILDHPYLRDLVDGVRGTLAYLEEHRAPLEERQYHKGSQTGHAARSRGTGWDESNVELQWVSLGMSWADHQMTGYRNRIIK